MANRFPARIHSCIVPLALSSNQNHNREAQRGVTREVYKMALVSVALEGISILTGSSE